MARSGRTRRTLPRPPIAPPFVSLGGLFPWPSCSPLKPSPPRRARPPLGLHRLLGPVAFDDGRAARSSRERAERPPALVPEPGGDERVGDLDRRVAKDQRGLQEDGQA